VNYAIGGAVLGFVYTHSQFEGSSSFGSKGGVISFDNYELTGRHALTPQLTLGAAYTYTDGHVDKTARYETDPAWNQINLQAVYMLSNCTNVYAEAMYQHTTGKNYVAFEKTSDGASSTANQLIVALGMRVRF
jgi:predicted porin